MDNQKKKEWMIFARRKDDDEWEEYTGVLRGYPYRHFESNILKEAYTYNMVYNHLLRLRKICNSGLQYKIVWRIFYDKPAKGWRMRK